MARLEFHDRGVGIPRGQAQRVPKRRPLDLFDSNITEFTWMTATELKRVLQGNSTKTATYYLRDNPLFLDRPKREDYVHLVFE